MSSGGDEMAPGAEEARDSERGEREARALRRLLRCFRSTDSYGLVVLMIVVTYALAAGLSERWGATILVLVQIGTVRLALHSSRARRGLLLTANVLIVMAALGAVVN